MDDLKLTIYLAGTTAAVDYRNLVELKYSNKFNILDPLKNMTREKVSKIIGNNVDYIFVVKRDKKLILNSDILVAYIKDGVSTFGTSMEILFAHDNSIPVFVIDETKKTFDDYWVKFHSSKFFNSIDDCFDYILNNL